MGDMDLSNLEESRLAIVHGILIGDVSPIKVNHKSPDKQISVTAIIQSVWYHFNLNLEK